MDLYIGFGQYFAPDSWAVPLGPIIITFLTLCAYTASKVKKRWVTTALITVPVIILWILAAVYQFEGWLFGTTTEMYQDFNSTYHIIKAIVAQIFNAILAFLAIKEAYRRFKPLTGEAVPVSVKNKRVDRIISTVSTAALLVLIISLNFLTGLKIMIGLHSLNMMNKHQFFVGADAPYSPEKISATRIDHTWFEPDTIKEKRALWNISGAGLAPPVYSWWVGEDVSRPKIDQLAVVHLATAGSDMSLPLICGYYEGKLANVDWLIATTVNLLDEPAFKHVTDLCPATFPSDVTLSKPIADSLFKRLTPVDGA